MKWWVVTVGWNTEDTLSTKKKSSAILEMMQNLKPKGHGRGPSKAFTR